MAGVCALALLEVHWLAGEFEELAKEARTLLELPDRRAAAQLALARAAKALGDPGAAVEHLAQAGAYGELLRLAESMSVSLDFLTTEQHVRASERTMTLLRDHVEQALGAREGEPPLPGVGLLEALDRIAYYYALSSRPQVVEYAAVLLGWASDRAWDREDLHAAATARRHLCELLARTGHGGAARLAPELSWLATLLKQQGRISEAEALYQQAVETGRGVLEPMILGSIIGRYGNLLHQIGEFEAAVHVQWQALRTRRPELDLSEHPADLAPAELYAALTPWTASYAEAVQWAVQLANLTRCLLDTGYDEHASVTFARAGESLEHARPLASDPSGDFNFRTAAEHVEELAGAFPVQEFQL